MLGWASYIALPALVRLAREDITLIIAEKTVCTAWWLTGRAVYLNQRLPSSTPCVKFSFLYATWCLFLTLLPWVHLPCPFPPSILPLEGFVDQSCRRYLPEAVMNVFLVNWWVTHNWRGACLYQLLLASEFNTCIFGHMRCVCPAAQRWTDAVWKERERKGAGNVDSLSPQHIPGTSEGVTREGSSPRSRLMT